MSKGTTARQFNNPKTTDTTDISSLLPKDDIKDVDMGETVQLTALEQFILTRWNIRQEDLSDNVSLIVKRMEEYMAKMNGSVMIPSDTIGAENQLYLLNTLMRALSFENEDMLRSVDIILFLINANRQDTFRDDMVYRFIPYIKRPAEDLDSYTRILEIFLKISNPLQRAELAQSEKVKRAITLIHPNYKQATFALVTYMTQY